MQILIYLIVNKNIKFVSYIKRCSSACFAVSHINESSMPLASPIRTALSLVNNIDHLSCANKNL